MDTRKFRKSKWLKSSDLDGPTVVTVESVTAEHMRNSGEDELVVKFAEFDKRLVLNGPNHDALMEVGGYDSERWIGQRVELYAKPEPMAKTGYAVRIRAAAPPVAQPVQQGSAAADGAPFSDDIPF
jgi:hypothetical protein